MYAKRLRLHRGVDNRLQFQFLNQDQKPVDLTGKDITFRLIGSDNKTILLQKSLTMVLPLTGIAELQVSADEVTEIPAQLAFYSLEIPVDQFNLPVFMDNDSGARGSILIEDSILPKFVESNTVTVSNVANSMNLPTVTYYSSIIPSDGKYLSTVQSFLNGYTGTVTIQGSTIPDADWYNIGTRYNYNEATECVGYNIEGYHPYIRFEFTKQAGSVDKLLVR